MTARPRANGRGLLRTIRRPLARPSARPFRGRSRRAENPHAGTQHTLHAPSHLAQTARGCEQPSDSIHSLPPLRAGGCLTHLPDQQSETHTSRRACATSSPASPAPISRGANSASQGDSAPGATIIAARMDGARRRSTILSRRQVGGGPYPSFAAEAPARPCVPNRLLPPSPNRCPTPSGARRRSDSW